jgi:glycerol-3-phosphate dehydrogenase
MTEARARDRASLFDRLRTTPRWDVIVVGGGATGLGCAVDAASRGYATLLVEARDFASGTSSRSTKLIHGGVRYLAQGNVPLVREALAERALLLRNAPHLVHPQRFVVPAYRWYDQTRLALGLRLYDALARGEGVGARRVLDPSRTIAALPNIEPSGLRGSVAYWDAAFDDARLAIALMHTVFDHGGLAINYLPVTGFLFGTGRVAGVQVRDAESGEELELRARTVINACGVWSQSLERLGRDRGSVKLSPSQGAHLVLDAEFLPGSDALLIPRTSDGRVLFLIPWQGKVLLGTTDTPRADVPFEPAPFDDEVDYLLQTAGRYLARKPARSDIRSAFAGLRPLLEHGPGSTARLSREHKVSVARDGLVTVSGGKWTTYRRMAEDAVNAAEAAAGLVSRSCVTAGLSLHGAHPENNAALPCDVYGTDRPAVDALAGADGRPHPALSLSSAEIRFAARCELARSVEDVLARRHRALFADVKAARAAAPAVAEVMAAELGWDEERRQAELVRFDALAEDYLPAE